MKRVSVASPKPSRQYHYHDCYEFYYLHSGDRYYFINDKTYHVTEGSAVFIEPYTIHSSFNFEKSGYDRTVIYFRKDFVESILKGANSNAFEDSLSGSHISVLNIKSRTLTEAVGFAGNTHFGRVFKRIVGMSPMQYRKKFGKR